MNKILCFLILLNISATNSMELASVENSTNFTRYELEEETLPSQEDSNSAITPLTAENRDGILFQVFDRLITCFDKNTLITFSKVNHTYRYLCFPPKIKQITHKIIFEKPNKSVFSLAYYLKNMVLAERSLSESDLLDNRVSTEKDIQAFRDNNEVTINEALELTKNVQYSPTFWAFGGSAYLKEIMNRRNKQFQLGILGNIKSFCHSIRQDPILKYGSLGLLSTALILTSYDLYSLYYTPLSNYKCYDYQDTDDCTVFYSSARSPAFLYEVAQKSSTFYLSSSSDKESKNELMEYICNQLNKMVYSELLKFSINFFKIELVLLKIWFWFFI